MKRDKPFDMAQVVFWKSTYASPCWHTPRMSLPTRYERDAISYQELYSPAKEAHTSKIRLTDPMNAAQVSPGPETTKGN